MSLKNCSHWIFDMDGTLTIPIHDFNSIRRQLDIPENTPILEAIEQMEPRQAERARRRLHEIEMELVKLSEPQPGVRELLEHLVAGGSILGILTRNDEEIAEATLSASGLDQLFSIRHIVGRRTCAPKPSPAGVQHLLELWQASPDTTVMVGDFLYDIEAGRRAGVRTVHFDSSGCFPWPEFADYRITSMTELWNLTK